MIQRIVLCLAVITVMAGIASADEKQADKLPQFFIKQIVKHTPVKNQGHSGTCWSFGTTSFFESELLRLGRGEFDLSEMFVVRHVYSQKLVNYIRYHGATNFSEGSLPFDWIATVKKHGMVLENIFDGKNLGEKKHNHREMFRVVQAMLQAILRNRKLTPRWQEACEKVLSVYLGNIPSRFTYQGQEYTSIDFANQVLRLPLDEYVELTSFTHHPFYRQCCLEIPDNWRRHRHYYNVPIEDLLQTIDHALANGYSVIWDGDVSEKSFYRKGYAIIPKPSEDEEEAAKAKPTKSAKATLPPETKITQEMRQQTFDNFATTDDHLLHIVGRAASEDSRTFYYAKNSWGTKYKGKGYWYLSTAYVRLKTIAILLHQDALPAGLRQKLQIVPETQPR